MESEGTPFVSPGQRHGALKVHRCLKFNIDPDLIRETAGEQLNLLKRREISGMC